MKKLLEMSAFQLNAPSLTTMPLRLKFNTLKEKLRKPLWLMNLWKRSMIEFNTFLLKLKLSTILREITMSLTRLKLELSM